MLRCDMSQSFYTKPQSMVYRYNKSFGLIIITIWVLAVILLAYMIGSSYSGNREYIIQEKLDHGFERKLAFIENKDLNIYQTNVSLNKGDAFMVQFDIDGQDDDGGMIYIDLYSDGYDREDAEIRYSVGEGDFSVSRMLSYGDIHPQSCNLRIFTTGDTAAVISDLSIDRIYFKRQFFTSFCIAIAIITSFILAVAGMKDLSYGKAVVFLCGIIVLQSLVMVYWANQKSNYYVDELYSMEGARQYTGKADGSGYLYNGWEDEASTAKELRDKLVLNERESVFKESITDNISTFLKGRNYFWILNLIESISGMGGIESLPAILFNVFLFVITQFFLFFLLERIGVSTGLSLIATSWYGYTGMTIGNVEYIRFYTLSVLFIVITLYMHALMWMDSSIKTIIYGGVISGISVYLGYKNTELMLPLGAFLFFFFLLGLIIKKRWIYALSYGGIGGVIGALVLFRSGKLDMLIHSVDYISRAEAFNGHGDINRADEMMFLIHTANVESIWKKLCQCVELIRVYLFGNDAVMIGTCALLFMSVIFSLFISYDNKKGIEDDKPHRGFIFIIIGIAIVFTLFNTIAMNIVLRYYSFICFFVVAVTVYVVEKGVIESKRLCGAILSVLLAIGCISMNLSEKIPYIYQDDKSFHDIISEYSGIDSIVTVDVPSFQRTIYEAALCLDDDTHLRQISRDNGKVIISGGNASPQMLSDKILFWTFPGQNISDYLLWLEDNGYSYRILGTASTSEVFICNR